jgi:hypothetical protein
VNAAVNRSQNSSTGCLAKASGDGASTVHLFAGASLKLTFVKVGKFTVHMILIELSVSGPDCGLVYHKLPSCH